MYVLLLFLCGCAYGKAYGGCLSLFYTVPGTHQGYNIYISECDPDSALVSLFDGTNCVYSDQTESNRARSCIASSSFYPTSYCPCPVRINGAPVAWKGESRDADDPGFTPPTSSVTRNPKSAGSRNWGLSIQIFLFGSATSQRHNCANSQGQSSRSGRTITKSTRPTGSRRNRRIR